MASNLKKGLIGIGTVLGVLLGSKAAFAADCQQVMVFKDGIQEYAGPNTSTGVVVRGSATVRVRLYCADGKQGAVYTSDLPKKQDQPKVSEKKGNIEVTLISAFAEFEGTVSVEAGKSKELTFTDGSGATYKVVIQGKPGLVEQPALDAANAKIDGKADKGEAYTKPESDGRYPLIANVYPRPEADATFAKKSDSYPRLRLAGGPMAMYRPHYSATGGFDAYLAYRFGNPYETGFELALAGGAGWGDFPTRRIDGVPYTEPSVTQTLWHIGLIPTVDIVVGSRVNFPLGLFIGMQNQPYPGTSVGQEANGGTVWAVHPDSWNATFLLKARLAVKVHLTGEERKGLYLQFNAEPGGALVPVKTSAGGTDNKAQFQFVGSAYLGGAIPGT